MSAVLRCSAMMSAAVSVCPRASLSWKPFTSDEGVGTGVNGALGLGGGGRAVPAAGAGAGRGGSPPGSSARPK